MVILNDWQQNAIDYVRSQMVLQITCSVDGMSWSMWATPILYQAWVDE